MLVCRMYLYDDDIDIESSLRAKSEYVEFSKDDFDLHRNDTIVLYDSCIECSLEKCTICGVEQLGSTLT